MKTLFKHQKSTFKRIFKKHKLLLRSIAVTLVLTLLFTSLPMDGIIALAEQAIEDSKLITVVEELEEYRTEFSKTYLKSDGTLEAVVSSNPIHFNEDGEWVEIDSTLETAENEKGEEILQNKKGSFNVELPAELQNSSEIAIEKGKNKISIKLLETKKSKAKKNNEKKEKSEKLTKAQRKRMTAGELFEADNNQSSAVEYTSAYNETNIRYDVTPNEVKESIVLQKAPNKKATYSYEITADGLTAILNEDNSIDFFEGSKTDGAEPVFSMPAPHMFDSNDEYSYDIVTTLENKKGKYILTYKPSYEWLKSKDRAYPVTIDPTVTINSGIQDSYTFSGEGYGDSYTGYEQQLKVGTTAWIAPNDYWQTYLKFTDLPQIPYEDYRIDSAYLMLTPKATTGNWQEMELGVYELTEDWKNHQTGKVAERITFNNAPEDVGYSTATATVSRGGADNGVGVGFEIAHLMEKWYENPEENFGIKLAAHLEASQWNDNLVFHSSRSTTGTAPYLSLTYTEFVPVTGIEIIGKPENNKIFIDETLSLTITTTPENASDKEDIISNVVWSSDNPDIAEIDSVTGDVITKELGTATITATSGEYTDSFTLTVREHIPDEIYLMISDNYRLFEHEQYYISVATFYQNSGVYAEVEYHSNNPDVASVSENGIITANSVGTAVITAFAKEAPEVKATATITVVPIQSAEIVNLPENNSLDVYKSHRLDLEITADNYSAIEGDPAFIGRYAEFFDWSSSNPDVATIDAEGDIQPCSVGTTTISVSRPNGGEVLDSFTLTVYYIDATGIEITSYPEDKKLELNKSVYLYAALLPDNASQPNYVWNYLYWESSNTDVITVDGYGMITAVGYGTANITVEYEGLTDSIEITVPYYPTTEVGFIFSDSPHSLYIDDTVSFWGIVAPSNATDQRTRCTSSNPNVVSVTEISDTTSPNKTVSYQLKAVSVGTATIRLEAYNDPTVYDEITVTVEWREANYEYNLTEDYIFLGTSRQILTPGGAEYIVSIEDPTILSTDGNGKITALKTGTTKITIGTYGVTGAKPHECTITVLSYTDFNFFNIPMVTYGNSYAMTENKNVELRTDDTDKVEIKDNKWIKTIDIGWASVDVYYHGVCIHTIDFYIIESIAIVNKPENNTIKVGKPYESLGAKEMPTDVLADVEWYSGDESIAEVYYDVKSGRVILTGKSQGSVWIGAESSDPANPASDGFWLYVDFDVTSFYIDYYPDNSSSEDNILYINESGVFQADIYPNPNVYYNNIEWYVKEGDKNCIRFKSIIENGVIKKDTIKIYAAKAGKVEISAIIDNYIEAEISVSLEIRKPSSIITVPANHIIKIGTKYTFTADIMPEYAIGTWSSSNTNVGTIDDNGVFEALSNGETEITLLYEVGGKTYSNTVKICVSDVKITNVPGNRVLFVDGKRALNAKVYLSNTTSEDVVWATSNSSIATVDSNGEIIGKSAGEVTITAKYKNDTSQKAWVTITVKKTKSYYYYLDEEGNGGNHKRLIRANVEKDVIANSYYGGKNSYIETIELTSEESFKNSWNSFGKDGYDVGYVIIDCHGNEDGFGHKNSKVDFYISYTLISKLEYKEMQGLIVLVCSAGNLETLEREDENLSSAFAKKLAGIPVISSDATVWCKYDSDKDEYENLSTFDNLKGEKPIVSNKSTVGWLIYLYRQNKLTIYKPNQKETKRGGIKYTTMLCMSDLLTEVTSYPNREIYTVVD
ncbi:MAG: DNRLRE domain-containing protein [Ruminococcaceae bacterium]|nr:DNRLRE domain-containing protein [Oscillospiraceae bacterium]